MDPHVIFEDYGVPLTDLSSVTSGCLSEQDATELAELEELAQFMACSPDHRADAKIVASALGMLRPEQVAPVLTVILENTIPSVANLVIDLIDDPIIPTAVTRRLPHVTPAEPSDGLIMTAARAIVEVIDDTAELVSIATKSKKTPIIQRALIDLSPSIAGLVPQDDES